MITLHSQYLSGVLGNEWKDLGRYLNILDPELDNIREDYHGNLKEVKYQVLLAWKHYCGALATYGILANALMEVGRTDLADVMLSRKYDNLKMPSLYKDILYFDLRLWSGLLFPPAAFDLGPRFSLTVSISSDC